jgi:regulator of protease activity HflC (stomatin/prohibitin superfamily)
MLWTSVVIVRETEMALKYENGRFIGLVGPGRHRLLCTPWTRQELVRVDIRRQPFVLNGQELLTADAISVRLNVAVEYRVSDPVRAIHGVADFRSALYTLVQLALREEVQARTIDALLAERTALSTALLERVQTQAAEIGLEVALVGVRDIILPGDVKRMLSQEVEAQRKGRANLVAAREETAAARAKANTAQILAGNPVLLRLRELETLGEIGQSKSNTVLLALPSDVMSAVGALGRNGSGS